jgi:hypothetical protein
MAAPRCRLSSIRRHAFGSSSSAVSAFISLIHFFQRVGGFLQFRDDYRPPVVPVSRQRLKRLDHAIPDHSIISPQHTQTACPPASILVKEVVSGGALDVSSLLRWAVEFLQALAAPLPGGGVEDVDGRQFIHFETGNHLGPEHDPLRITGTASSLQGEIDDLICDLYRRARFGNQLDVRDRFADAARPNKSSSSALRV